MQQVLITDPHKAQTGIVGFDENTRGGLARGRVTLVVGGAGSGKTLFALQTLVNGARHYKEPGIFVAFEESSHRIKANSSKFGWNLDALQRKNLFFLDAQPTAEWIQSGSFDLDGMLAALGAKVKEMGAKRIAFDAIDVLLSLLDDPRAVQREVCKLNEWLLTRGLTAIITQKSDHGRKFETQFSFMEFMMDCVVRMNHTVEQGVSQRNVCIEKYRGSAFEENETPLVISGEGLEIAGSYQGSESRITVSNERISSGVLRLDTMLGGGYFRNSSVLISGFPGTAKTTLSGAFLEAACLRGERSLMVSFDSDANEVVRNLSSINIRLQRFLKNGLLRTKSAHMTNGSAEIHFMRIKKMVREHRARCVTIDPVSALAKSGDESTIQNVTERLIEWSKLEGITLLCTSLLDGSLSRLEGTPIQISTLADTWINLSYLVQAGERNRGLSIIKSRGTAHSNQTRELVLSAKGVTLEDAYLAGGEVLMGALRWERERAEQKTHAQAEIALLNHRVLMENEEADLVAQIKSLQRVLQGKKTEKNLELRAAALRVEELTEDNSHLRRLRRADAVNPTAK
jgi:circadian clock protein KaiC